MTSDLSALAVFVVATTFSPGPNNLAAASIGMTRGYRYAIPFTFGVFVAFAGVMCVSAVFSSLILGVFPWIQSYLRIVGALYIASLAIRLFLAGSDRKGDFGRTLGFVNGLLLQPLNPKVIVYGLTLFSAFLDVTNMRTLLIAGYAVGFAAVGLAATNLWAATAAATTKLIDDRKVMRWLNSILAILLMLSAVQLSGLLGK